VICAHTTLRKSWIFLPSGNRPWHETRSVRGKRLEYFHPPMPLDSSITCWNIWIDNREDCISVLCGHKISLYTGRPSGQRTEDCPPEPVLGDSVMSGRLLISGRHRWSLMCGRLLIPGRYLILTLTHVRKMKRNTRENEKNRILGCLVKTRNRVKKTLRGRNHGHRRKSASSKERAGR